jgi:hypothetical protein
VTRVPAVAGDVADLAGLREIGSRLAVGDPGTTPAAVDPSEEPEPAGRP